MAVVLVLVLAVGRAYADVNSKWGRVGRGEIKTDELIIKAGGKEKLGKNQEDTAQGHHAH